ncbi:hypothetical protein AB0C04_24770 [Micromonospora sp. NPDC048909]|uniref:hypothetical protein n=1 Tax=Micromonospora sp. NPDC048909 TaxID=3155643 RepID=UPI0034059502
MVDVWLAKFSEERPDVVDQEFRFLHRREVPTTVVLRPLHDVVRALNTAYMTCAYLGGGVGSWLGVGAYAHFGRLGVCGFLALLAAVALGSHLRSPYRSGQLAAEVVRLLVGSRRAVPRPEARR